MPESVACAADPARFRASKPHGPRAAKHRLSPLTQALDLKDLAYKDAHASETPVHIRAALMRAFVDLLDLCMALRGQGKPKPVEARNATPKAKRNAVTAPVVYPGPSEASQAAVVNDVKPTS